MHFGVDIISRTINRLVISNIGRREYESAHLAFKAIAEILVMRESRFAQINLTYPIIGVCHVVKSPL